MGHFHIQWKRNKKNHKIIQGHTNKNRIQIAEHNRKQSETISTNKHNKCDIYQMKCLDCPLKYEYTGQQAKHPTPETKNIYRQLEIIRVVQDTRTTY
jgi:hypothetical protein